MPYKDPAAQRKSQRERWARIRAEYFAGKACVDCGSTERLELDHVDPSTKLSHKIWSWAPARRAAELAKCVVRCHDCHVAKTKRDFPPQGHGTPACYKRGCRCQECRDAENAYRRLRRAVRASAHQTGA